MSTRATSEPPAVDPFALPPEARAVGESAPRERPLRIRVLHTRFPHWGAHAGMTQFVRYLDATRARAELWTASDSDADLPVPWPSLRDRLRREVQRRGMGWYKLSDLAAELRALPGCATGRTDVVHFLDAEHGAQYLPALLRPAPHRGGRRARAQGIARLLAPPLAEARTVATFHQPPALLDELVDRRVVRNIDLVTVVAPTQLEWFLDVLPPERVALVPHGIDTGFFRPAPTDVGGGRRRGTPFRCITVGHWLRDWTAVRAVAERLAGEREIEFHAVTARTTGLEKMGNVVHHRTVDDATLLRLYQTAHLLFLPLTGSTANNSLLEGIACGLPAVTTDLEAVRAYLPGEQGVFVADNDPGALADAVMWLKEDNEARLLMARRARARAEELAWPRVARRFEQLYERATTPARPAATA